MEMNILEEEWKKLWLSKGEAKKIVFDEDKIDKLQHKEDRSLVGKVCSMRIISKEILRLRMAKVWRVSKAAIFTEVSANIFVITFDTHADKLRVWGCRPWLFDNHSLALKMFDSFTPPHEMIFEREIFWVRMQYLPLAYMTKARRNILVDL